jgi:hypothetical protein
VMVQALDDVFKKVDSALNDASNLSATSTVEAAKQVATADGAAAQSLFEWIARLPDRTAVSPTRPPIPWFRFLAGVALFLIAILMLFALGYGLFGKGHLVDRLAEIEVARGLITYTLALGTIAIAVLLVVGAMLGDEASKENFSRGKEVLTVLVGIFGTILGFYYGSEKAEKARLHISPVTIVRSGDKAQSLIATVTGGRAPYRYSIKFKDPDLEDVLNRETLNGIINEVINTSNLSGDKQVSFTIDISDADRNQVSREATDQEKLSSKISAPEETPPP